MKFTTQLSLCFALVSALGVAAMPSNITERDSVPHLHSRGPGVYTKCSKPNTVALTFDDGPYIYQKTIVDLLEANGAKGTFFVNGNNYGCIYTPANRNSITYAYSRGHQIAPHTWSHPHLKTLTKDQVLTEFQRIDEALLRILGINSAMMRPPYGEYNDNVVSVATSRGQKVIIWDFDSGDSAGKTAAQSNALYQQITDQKPSSVLTLNHETYPATAHSVIPNAVAMFKAKGYNMVTVADCLGIPAYQSVVTPGKYDSSWTC